ADQGRVEVGIASVPKSRIGPNAIPLMADPLGIICRADHALVALDRPVTWSDLDGHAFMANGICSFISAPAMRSVLERSSLMVRNTTSLIALVTEGVGITILPQLSMPAGHDQLRFLPIEGVTDLRRLYVVTRANSALSPAVEAFIEALLETVAVRGWGENSDAAE
ncbi:MAG: LysR substrate-binding domain-containing protein, partial [Alphaproteobacteria bacterium]|nr:LysR substrate-binding domain-containing protein [Alphaproteobacteria bacterium]